MMCSGFGSRTSYAKCGARSLMMCPWLGECFDLIVKHGVKRVFWSKMYRSGRDSNTENVRKAGLINIAIERQHRQYWQCCLFIATQ